MPRRSKARRFDPFYPISDSTLATEAEHVRREFDNYARLAVSEIDSKRAERFDLCRNSWEQLCVLLQSIKERDRRIVQALMFRDLWYVLQLYKTYLSLDVGDQRPATTLPSKTQPAEPLKFSEWLFDPPERIV